MIFLSSSSTSRPLLFFLLQHLTIVDLISGRCVWVCLLATKAARFAILGISCILLQSSVWCCCCCCWCYLASRTFMLHNTFAFYTHILCCHKKNWSQGREKKKHNLPWQQHKQQSFAGYGSCFNPVNLWQLFTFMMIIMRSRIVEMVNTPLPSHSLLVSCNLL